MSRNVDPKTVKSFGDEWVRFDQSAIEGEEASAIFDDYFSIFPWDRLDSSSVGFDMGCGSGRWALIVAPRVGRLNCIDPSEALSVARRKLAQHQNVCFYRASVDSDVIEEASQDFGYSLGVLHHIPVTGAAMIACTRLLKPGAPFLVYLYYAFDNRPFLFRAIWHCSEVLRAVVSRLPPRAKHLVTDSIAGLVYWPLARFARVAERLGFDVSNLPLSYYRALSFYTMRTDSRDRFGTPLEQRFSRVQVEAMMHAAGLVEVRFSEHAPFWCAVGFKK